MIEMGIVVGLAILVLFFKLGWKWRIWMLSHPVLFDIVVFAFLTTIHWGTYSGVMVAAVGALFCSICFSIGRWAFGYIQNGMYITGKVVNVWNHIQPKS